MFLFATMAAAPLMAGDSASISDTVKITQEAIAQSVVNAPLVNVFPPKVVKMDNLGDETIRGTRIFIREIDDSRNVMNTLLGMEFDGLDDGLINATSDDYGSEDGGYVNMGISDTMTGMLNVDRIDPEVTSRLQELCNNPETYGVDAVKLNVQLMPKVIEVATVNINNEITKHQVLAMEPWTGSSIDKTAVKTMLTRSYSTFKAYTTMMDKRSIDNVEIHTGFWGADEGNVDPFTSTVIQMMAADMAGVDTLTFHNADADSGVIQQARSFLDAREGQNVSDILDDLVGA